MKQTNHHGWKLPKRETLLTPASAVTFVRTIVAVIIAVIATIHHDQLLLFVALACYWVGDIADGIVARTFKHEMRSGALLDIVPARGEPQRHAGDGEYQDDLAHDFFNPPAALRPTAPSHAAIALR